VLLKFTAVVRTSAWFGRFPLNILTSSNNYLQMYTNGVQLTVCIVLLLCLICVIVSYLKHCVIISLYACLIVLTCP